MKLLASSLLILLALSLVAPTFATRDRFVSERKDRLREAITDELGLALKVGFHSGCSGCLASDYDFNWCVHPDNDGIGACVVGDCSSYDYYSIFDVPNTKRVAELSKNFKDGSYICNSEREPAFRVKENSYTSFGVQSASTTGFTSLIRENSALTAMSSGVIFSDQNTFSRGIIPNFCDLPQDTVIDRTQGGPDFLINAGYEHCLMANSELRGVLERECGPEAECFTTPILVHAPTPDISDGFPGDVEHPDNGGIPIGIFIFDTSRFFYYQCDQLRMETEEQRDHYNWIVSSLRSVSCANDCHPYGEPFSGVCEHSCTRINDAYTIYQRTYGSGAGFFGPDVLASQFEQIQSDDGDSKFAWKLTNYTCVPDDTPLCKEVNLKDTVSDRFRAQISPEAMSHEEAALCLKYNFR